MDGEFSVSPDGKPDAVSLLRALAEASPMPMVGVEAAEHLVRYVNPAYCLLVDKRGETLIGKPFCEIEPTDDICRPLLDRVYKTQQVEVSAAQDDSRPNPWRWAYSMWPILLSDSRLTAIAFQVTETEHSRQQATAMNQALLLASVRQHEMVEEAGILNEQLRRANEDLKQFAFAASHDLQEPLRMITIYSQLLITGYGGQLDGEPAVCVDFITRGARRMRGLLADLLSYAEAGLDRGDKSERVDLNSVLEKVLDRLRPIIDASSAIVTCEPLPDVRGQEAHLVQLFQNLIGNAIKYHSEHRLRIHVAAEQRNGAWCFSVADNGIGIDPAHHQNVFGVFKRLHGQNIEGTGIGLAICQRVVERYGGSIWVESQLGQGSTFYFTLPDRGKNP